MPCRLPIFPAVMDPNLTSIRACDSRALIDMTGLGLGFYASEIVMYFKPSFFMRVRPIKYKLWKKRLFSAITTLPWKYDHHITLEVRSPHYPGSGPFSLNLARYYLSSLTGPSKADPEWYGRWCMLLLTLVISTSALLALSSVVHSWNK